METNSPAPEDAGAKRPRWRSVLDVTTSVAVVVVAVAVVVQVARPFLAGPATPGTPTPEVPPHPVPVADTPFLGDPNAPVIVMAFSDFQCPYCEMFNRAALPTLKANALDTGMATFVFRHSPLSDTDPCQGSRSRTSGFLRVSPKSVLGDPRRTLRKSCARGGRFARSGTSSDRSPSRSVVGLRRNCRPAPGGTGRGASERPGHLQHSDLPCQGRWAWGIQDFMLVIRWPRIDLQQAL